MYERAQGGNSAILVNISFLGPLTEEALSEFKELALAAGATIVGSVSGQRVSPDAKYFIGSGKAAEVQRLINTTATDLVLFNHNLSPAQERNLEQLFQCRVLDRTGLILDIFAQRARTFEGKLQVELAQLQHIATRLVRGWTHLERQRGGIGLRGPGETQLETDRRLIRNRIKTIKQRLEKVQRQRGQGRRARQRSAIPTVSVVGYTNAGKSTLFNQLTHAEVYVADKPFATLDPTLRRIELTNGTPAILADTVGFIQDLPHDLVEAFRATLEETQKADLLLHVIDAHNQNKDTQTTQVNAVLTQINAQKIPQLLIYNKIDLLPQRKPRLDRDALGKPYRVWISAVTGVGLNLLKQALSELLEKDIIQKKIKLAPEQSKLRATLYQLNAIQQESLDKNGNWLLTIRLSQQNYQRLFTQAGKSSLS